MSVSRATSLSRSVVDDLPWDDPRRILADLGFSMLSTLPLAPHRSLSLCV